MKHCLKGWRLATSTHLHLLRLHPLFPLNNLSCAADDLTLHIQAVTCGWCSNRFRPPCACLISLSAGVYGFINLGPFRRPFVRVLALMIIMETRVTAVLVWWIERWVAVRPWGGCHKFYAYDKLFKGIMVSADPWHLLISQYINITYSPIGVLLFIYLIKRNRVRVRRC